MPAKLHPYLSFDGNCAEAFAFYNTAIANGAAEVTIRLHSSAPAEFQRDPAWGDKVLHAQLVFGQLVLFGSDIPPEHRVAPNPMVNLSLHLDELAEAERVFAALAEGGAVFMPMAETFWAKGFGMLRDRYGFSWMVSACQP